MYLYIRSEPTLWTVGCYDPRGTWHSDSDHADRDQAAARVAHLNGAVNAALLAALKALESTSRDHLAAPSPLSLLAWRATMNSARAAIDAAEGLAP